MLEDSEAAVVKFIYDTYRKCNSIGKVKKELDVHGYTTKRNNSFSRKSIYNILTNRYYVGMLQEYTKQSSLKTYNPESSIN